jgi:hypothetical protein
MQGFNGHGVSSFINSCAWLCASACAQGFGRNKAARALLAVSNAGAQQALDYLLAFGDSLEDTPLGELTQGAGTLCIPLPPAPACIVQASFMWRAIQRCPGDDCFPPSACPPTYRRVPVLSRQPRREVTRCPATTAAAIPAIPSTSIQCTTAAIQHTTMAAWGQWWRLNCQPPAGTHLLTEPSAAAAAAASACYDRVLSGRDRHSQEVRRPADGINANHCQQVHALVRVSTCQGLDCLAAELTCCCGPGYDTISAGTCLHWNMVGCMSTQASLPMYTANICNDPPGVRLMCRYLPGAGRLSAPRRRRPP